jgi:hypothetical protein
LNFRQGLLAGALGAALSAGVACLRVPERGTAFLVLLGGGALFFGLALGGVAVARPLAVSVRAVLIGVGLAALPLAKLAAQLKLTTHHRPLGAVTFAVLALLFCFITVAVAARVLSATETNPSATGRIARPALFALAVLGPLALLVRAAASPELRPGLFDVAFGLGSGALLGLVPWPAKSRQAAEAAALPIWAGLVVAGILTGLVAGGSPAQLSSPALSAPLSWILR